MSFADRPYRTFDSIPVAQFFNYTLVQDFFAGPNPPNAIIAGELPSDIALNKLDSASEQGGGHKHRVTDSISIRSFICARGFTLIVYTRLIQFKRGTQTSDWVVKA